MRELPIGPEEAFVLSRVDGSVTDAEIVAMTGLAPDRARVALQRLVELGAIRYPGEGGSPSGATVTPCTPAPQSPAPSTAREQAVAVNERPSSSEPAERQAPHSSTRPQHLTPAPPPPQSDLYPQSELDDEAELDRDRKRCILELYYRLDQLDYYQLLGVPRDADRRAVKSAYYRVVTLFHPDRYFGRDLGSFKSKLERVFSTLTQAQEVLGRRRTREQYDATPRSAPTLDPARVAALEQLHAWIASMAAAGRPSVPDPDLSGGESGESILSPGSLPGSAPPISSVAPPATDPRISGFPPRAQPSRLPALAGGPGDSWAPPLVDSAGGETDAPSTPRSSSLPPAQRRKALARKLLGSVPPPARPSTPPSLAGLREALTAVHDNQAEITRSHQVRKYMQAAEESLAEGKCVAAANALRVAATIAPDDAALADKLAEVDQLAAVQMADTYLEQAREEEKNGHPAQAAAAYEKAARGRPSSSILQKAAGCLLEADSDLKHAGQLARRAIELNERSIEARVILARIYAAAGMTDSAMAELERASALAPNDASVRNLMKQLRRGD